MVCYGLGLNGAWAGFDEKVNVVRLFMCFLVCLLWLVLWVTVLWC